MIKKGRVTEIKMSGDKKIACRVEFPDSRTVSGLLPLAAGNDDLKIGDYIAIAYWSQLDGIALAIIKEVE